MLSEPCPRFVSSMFVIKVVADITTEIWPVSSRQIAERDHSSDLDRDLVPSSSDGQMMIGGEGRRVAEGEWRIALQGGAGRKCNAPLVLAGKGTRW